MTGDPLIEAAGLVADGAVLDWGSMSSRLSTDEERALADELSFVAKIAQQHWRLQELLPGAVAATAAEEVALDRSNWGHLQLLEVLGRGSYGTVYRAWDGRLDRQVALKLFHGASDPEAVMREGRMLARIQHENVVAVYGADVNEGVAGIWMEFVRGRNLDQIVKDQGPFGAQEATLVGLDLSRALAAVHAKGLLHCDIKAQNVIREPGGRLVLMDLGAGRTVPGTGDTTAIGYLTGTPRYMAPEMFDRRPASPQSDLYSLGVLLFYLVSGTFPVDGKSLVEIQTAHQEGRRQHLRDLCPDLPAGFLREVTRATDPDPFERHHSAVDLEAALVALAPVVVPPEPDVWQRLTARKALAAAGVLALILAAGLLTWKLLPRGVTLGSPSARSIAVLPIRNLTGDPANTYLADDFTEVVISHLSRVRAFTVPSFATVSAYRDQVPSASVAKPLRADLLLTGSLVDVGGRLGIVMHLIDPSGDRMLWAREFSPEAGGLLSVPAEIARQLAEFLSS